MKIGRTHLETADTQTDQTIASLIPVYQPGALWRNYRIWKRTRAPELYNTGALSSTLERLAYPNGQQIDQEETIILPAIAPTSSAPATDPQISVPRHVTCTVNNNPLAALYGACLASIDKLGARPDVLYISVEILPQLKRQHKKVVKIAFDDQYRFLFDVTIHYIPVRPEAELPTALKFAYGPMDKDMVIAVAN